MSDSNTSRFAIGLRNYPQMLLLGSQQFDLIFNGVNYSEQPEQVNLQFSSDGLDLLNSDQFAENIPFDPSESKDLTLSIIPNRDGYLTLTVITNITNQVEYKEMVWKVRDKVDQALLQRLMKDTPLHPKDLAEFKASLPTSIDPAEVTPLSQDEAQAQINRYDNPSEIFLTEEKDTAFFNIARGVFTQDPNLGFQILKKISDPNLLHAGAIQLISICISIDPKLALNVVMELPESNRDQYYELIAEGIALDNPQDAAMAALNISDENKKETVLTEIIFGIADQFPDIASNLVYQINNETIRLKVLFEVVKKIANIDKNQAVESLKNVISNVLSGANIDFIKKCAVFLAYLTSPQAVFELVESFGENEKSFLIDQLRDYLKIQVEEKKIKIEFTPIGEMTYTFTGCVSVTGRAIETLAQLGGTLSANLLTDERKPSALFLNLFSFSFQYASGFQQANLDLQNEFQREFAYIIFPSQNGLEPTEWDQLRQVLDQFCIQKSNLYGSPQIVFNLDFIPYTTQPTVIFGNDSDLASQLAQKTQKVLGNQANVLVNAGIFRDGKIHKDLQSILPAPKFMIINLVISYNFFNSYPLLKAFFKAMI